MKRKKNMMSFFQRKEADSETEPDCSCVDRPRESREPAEREQEYLSDGETESEGKVEQESQTDGETEAEGDIEAESETDGETEAEGDMEAESETPPEEPRASTSSGPSGL